MDINFKERINLTQKDFEYFKKKVKYWLKKFGLKEWDTFFEFKKDTNGGFAEINWNCEKVKATITLKRKWNCGVSDKKYQIEKTALHEVLHLLLAPLAELNIKKVKSYSSKYITEEHKIINRLISVLLKED